MTLLFRFLVQLVLALFAVALTFVILFFLMPSWQKAVVERVLPETAGEQWQVGRIGLGPTEMTAGDIFVLQDGAGLEIGDLVLAGPFWKTPLSGALEVTSGEISGVFIDVSTISVGDLTSSDWRSFVERISGDTAFWEERIGLILSKVAESGWNLSLKDVSIRGQALLPGERMVPLSLHLIEADSREPQEVRLETLAEDPEAFL
ncbi:MAG TPA: hypothetical protein VJ960_03105 [Oceanipulchritudo sp.]|nr:hypothetical protein [Oceanipulchritudo sp.]